MTEQTYLVEKRGASDRVRSPKVTQHLVRCRRTLHHKTISIRHTESDDIIQIQGSRPGFTS